MTQQQISEVSTLRISTSKIRALRAVFQGIANELLSRSYLNAELGGLSEQQLRDIGLKVTDVTCLGGLPLRTSSADVLSHNQKLQSCNW